MKSSGPLSRGCRILEISVPRWAFSIVVWRARLTLEITNEQDTIKVYKRGHCFRLDTTLVGFEDLTWIRGNLSLLCVPVSPNASDPPHQRGEMQWVLIDHERKLVQKIWPRNTEEEDEGDPTVVEEEVSISLNSPLVRVSRLLSHTRN